VLDAAVQVADDFLDHGTSSAPRAAPRMRSFASRPSLRHQQWRAAGAAGQRRLGFGLGDTRRRAARQSRATLIGRRTYGKGSVQTIMPLGDGQALKITTSRYFTPAGISINGVGIVPDTVLQGTEQPPAAMDTADHVTLAQRDPQVSVHCRP